MLLSGQLTANHARPVGLFFDEGKVAQPGRLYHTKRNVLVDAELAGLLSCEE